MSNRSKTSHPEENAVRHGVTDESDGYDDHGDEDGGERPVVPSTIPLSLTLKDFPRDDLSLRLLLTHTSGLIAHQPFFETLKGDDVRAAVFAESLTGGPLRPRPLQRSELHAARLGLGSVVR